MKNMNYWEEDMFLAELKKLDSVYRKKVLKGEISLKEAFNYQQTDEYYADQEWIEQMEEKEKVIYAPKAKISTICETDDIPF